MQAVAQRTASDECLARLTTSHDRLDGRTSPSSASSASVFHIEQGVTGNRLRCHDAWSLQNERGGGGPRLVTCRQEMEGTMYEGVAFAATWGPGWIAIQEPLVVLAARPPIPPISIFSI